MRVSGSQDLCQRSTAGASRRLSWCHRDIHLTAINHASVVVEWANSPSFRVLWAAPNRAASPFFGWAPARRLLPPARALPARKTQRKTTRAKSCWQAIVRSHECAPPEAVWLTSCTLPHAFPARHAISLWLPSPSKGMTSDHWSISRTSNGSHKKISSKKGYRSHKRDYISCLRLDDAPGTIYLNPDATWLGLRVDMFPVV